MSFRCVQTAFTFYKEHSRLTGFGVVKKSAKKLVGQLKNVTFGCDKCQKTTTSNQSKRVDCKAKVNCQVMNDGLCIVTKVILENNHELEPAVFFSSQRELSRTVKRSLVVHDIVGLRPSKSIRLLEVEAQGSERMRTWLKAMGEITPTAILTDQCERLRQSFVRCCQIPSIGRSSLKQFVEQYEVALRSKYEKELESQANERKQLV
ncbi:hypothetical protein FXO38_34246 [Capsicum annuum]|uniref:Protein FAR1-RELATED SEQUENCE n=1 Tax=Capsicum annuum TaxID=4072 RepID=A0A2G3AKY4_CAPAN|nr:hypothetical protein FXO38_34246 [Capsicum annuum]KAF3659698.1 hypothetical protein FXO37_13857 [Capsicum annuum]PHT94905.1 hypothetical protein T459_02787 [Capsicum annuum]